jgi:hypothetical protein
MRYCDELYRKGASRWLFEVAEFPVNVNGADTRIDFVLHAKSAWGHHSTYLVCECKRPNPALGEWAFMRSWIGVAATFMAALFAGLVGVANNRYQRAREAERDFFAQTRETQRDQRLAREAQEREAQRYQQLANEARAVLGPELRRNVELLGTMEERLNTDASSAREVSNCSLGYRVTGRVASRLSRRGAVDDRNRLCSRQQCERTPRAAREVQCWC